MPSTKTLKHLLSVVIMSLGFATTAGAQTTVRISYQPLYWALPFFIASEKSYWKEVGLVPEFSVFPAGPQQIAALQSWDLGGTGSPPAVLGAVRFGLLSAAIGTDESAVTLTMARAGEAEKILNNPASLKGQQLLVTTNSTGKFSALACLKKFGLTRNDVQIVNLAPTQLISAYSNGNGTLAASWAPFAYVLLDKAGAVEICNGQQAGAYVTSSFVVHPDFATKEPAAVAKALAVYLRGVAWQRKNRAETIAYLKRFNENHGVSLSDKFLDIDHDRRKTFTLSEQLQIFDRTAGAATVEKWHNDLAAYLVSTGTITAAPDPNAFLTDRFLKIIDGDPKLRAFVNED
jgi:NitT/TauT family transport system substrate-binding protein